jgi:hypothetical protein
MRQVKVMNGTGHCNDTSVLLMSPTAVAIERHESTVSVQSRSL